MTRERGAAPPKARDAPDPAAASTGRTSLEGGTTVASPLNHPKRTLVLDLETRKPIDFGDRRSLEELGVSVVGIYRYDVDRYETYDESAFSRLSQLLSEAERVVGFNIVRFDLPVLQPHVKVPLRRLPSLDLLEDLRRVLGHRVSLNAVARATLGIEKSGDGLQAVRFYERGEMDRLRRYCLDDVRITRAVYEHGCREGKVWIPPKLGRERRAVPVTWGQPPPETPASRQGTLF